MHKHSKPRLHQKKAGIICFNDLETESNLKYFYSNFFESNKHLHLYGVVNVVKLVNLNNNSCYNDYFIGKVLVNMVNSNYYKNFS